MARIKIFYFFYDFQALQTKAAIGEREGKVDNKTRIELIKEEERLIKEEQQETKKVKAAAAEKEKEKALPPIMDGVGMKTNE